MKIDKLVLGAGGGKGLLILGYLECILNYYPNVFKGVKEYWGSSVGSVICLLLSVGYTPFELFHIFYNHETINTINPNISSEIGMYSIAKFGEEIKEILLKKINFTENPTFQDLYNLYKNKVYIVGTNVDACSEEIFSVDTHPSMLVIDAIEISCDLPFIFTKKVYKGVNYTDGAVSNEFPIDRADTDDSKILGIRILTNYDTTNYFYNLLRIPMKQITDNKLEYLGSNCTIVQIEYKDENFVVFPDKKTKIKMFGFGYKYCEKQYTGWDVDFSF